MILGLVLVDPPVGNTFFVDERGKQQAQTPIILRSDPFQGGYDNFFPAKSSSSSSNGVNTLTVPPRSSLFDDLIYYWMEEVPHVFNPHAPTLLSLSYYPLKVIVAEWMNVANLLHYTVENLEYSFEDLSITLSELQRLESDLRRLQSWRRRTSSSLDKIRSLVYMVESFGSDSAFSEIWESLLGDIQHVIHKINVYSERFNGLVPVFSSSVQIVESRRSISQAESITRLTYLALVSIPLTFVSGLFSMNGDFLPGRKKSWIYFTVAIPLMMVVFAVVRLGLNHPT